MCGYTIAILAQVIETETASSNPYLFAVVTLTCLNMYSQSNPKETSRSVWDAALADTAVPYESGTEAEFPQLAGQPGPDQRRVARARTLGNLSKQAKQS